MPLAHLTKILVMPNLLSLVWFVANFLAAHGTTSAALTDSSQNFGQHTVAEFCDKNWLANFGRAVMGIIQKYPICQVNESQILIVRGVFVFTLLTN
jgi:hypothetical protein